MPCGSKPSSGLPGQRGARFGVLRSCGLGPTYPPLACVRRVLGAFATSARRCGEKSTGRYRIEMVPLPTAADRQRSHLVRRFAARDSDIDLIGMDGIWVPEFVASDPSTPGRSTWLRFRARVDLVEWGAPRRMRTWGSRLPPDPAPSPPTDPRGRRRQAVSPARGAVVRGKRGGIGRRRGARGGQRADPHLRPRHRCSNRVRRGVDGHRNARPAATTERALVVTPQTG
jgi:hypothetical protein